MLAAPVNDTSTQWRSVMATLCLVGAAGCGSDSEADTCRALDFDRKVCGPESVRLPVLDGHDSPVIAATIDGRPARLLIDTGADKTVISSQFLEAPDESGLRADVCLGDVCVESEPVWAWETPFSSADGDITGFVGMLTLRPFVVSLDRGAFVEIRNGGAPCGGDAFELGQTEFGTPLVDVSIEGHGPSDVALDTGGTYTTLSQATADLLGAPLLDGSEPASLCTVEGCEENAARTSTVASYCVGERCADDVRVKFPVWDGVGNTFLSRYEVDLDFVEDRIVFCD